MLYSREATAKSRRGSAQLQGDGGPPPAPSHGSGPLPSTAVRAGNGQPKRQHQSPAAIVAGGAGFLGSHLCDRLLADGYRVYCIDSFCSRMPGPGRLP